MSQIIIFPYFFFLSSENHNKRYFLSLLRTFSYPAGPTVTYKQSASLAGLFSFYLVSYYFRRKWNSFARYVFYFNVIFYLLFLISLTGYIQTSPRQSTIIQGLYRLIAIIYLSHYFFLIFIIILLSF